MHDKGFSLSFEVDLVNIDVPLLIGLPSLRAAKDIIDCDSGSVYFAKYDKYMHGACVSDRLLLSVMPSSNVAQHIDVALTELEAKRLHHHFKHVSVEGIARALKNSGRKVTADDRKILSNIVSNCLQCKLSSSLPWRPVVAYPYPTTFNNRIAMDVFTINGMTVLHIICLGTHYSRLIPLSIFNALDKESSKNVFEIFYCFWINQLGLCDIAVVDQGKNFVSQEFYYNCEAYGIVLKPVPTNSP